MVDLSKVSGWVQKAVADITAFGGNTRKIDSQAEKNALSSLLAGDLSSEDKEYIEGFMLERGASKTPKSVVHDIKFGDNWEELVEAYFPTWKECFGKLEGKDGAVRALKKALATKEDGTLDNALYQKLLAGYIPSSISVPEQIGDCKRDGDAVKVLKFRQPEGRPIGYMGSVGIQTNTDGEVTLTDCKGRAGKGKNIEEAISNLNSNLAKGEKPYTESDIVK